MVTAMTFYFAGIFVGLLLFAIAICISGEGTL